MVSMNGWMVGVLAHATGITRRKKPKKKSENNPGPDPKQVKAKKK